MSPTDGPILTGFPVMKVGKNNFKPPPQVESSVVRIEMKPSKDRPNVSWDEFDGLLRVCFNRKNKTLRASWLGTKEVLVMLEKNYRVYCAMQNIPVDDSVVDDDQEEGMEVDGENDDDDGGGDDAGMDVDEDEDVPEFFKELASKAPSQPEKTKSKRKKTAVAKLVREKIRKVLEDDTDLADKRAGKCDENDFLRLLYAFNQEGIHFA